MAAGDDGTAAAWAQLYRRLASRGALSAAEVTSMLDGIRRSQGMAWERPPSTRDAVRVLASQWATLQPWEQAIWRTFLRDHGDQPNVMPVHDLRLTADMRHAMALRMSAKYMRRGAREAFEALINDPLFQSSVVLGIGAYLALWMTPEPFFTKAAAVLTTIGLVSVAGFTASEIITLARAWMALRDEAGKARTIRELEKAAERFGKQLGGTSLRVLLALTTLVGSKVLPASPGTAAPAVITSGTSSNAAVAVATPGVLVTVKAGAVVIIPTVSAMSAVGGGGKASPGSGAGSGSGGKASGSGGTPAAGPGKWARVKESMSERAAKTSSRSPAGRSTRHTS